jgi:signal peptidase I
LSKDKYLPLRVSGAGCFTAIIVFLAVYFFDIPFFASIFDSYLFSFILKPMLWFILVYIVLLLPRIKYNGKLRFKNLIVLWAFNFSLIFIILSIVCGLVDGFAGSPYSHTAEGMLLNIFAIGSSLLGREIFRNFITNRLSKNQSSVVFILIAALMAFTEMPLNAYINLQGYKNIIQFTAQYILPNFSHNLLAVYLCSLGGAVPSIVYMGLIKTFQWFSPVLPNLKWITSALIGSLCPVFNLLILQNIYFKEAGLLKKHEKESDASWIVVGVLSTAAVWFAVGVFPLYPSVIATGSMGPKIKPGDITIIDRTAVKNLKIGDIIQFRKDNIFISHRIVEIVNTDSSKLYRTKGDNNTTSDTELVKDEQIKGKIIKVVPKVGWPTLLFRSKEDISLDEIEF